MCAECIVAVENIFPGIPEKELGDFLMNCTTFPFGGPDIIKKQLEELRTKTDNYKECFHIIEKEMEAQHLND